MAPFTLCSQAGVKEKWNLLVQQWSRLMVRHFVLTVECNGFCLPAGWAKCHQSVWWFPPPPAVQVCGPERTEPEGAAAEDCLPTHCWQVRCSWRCFWLYIQKCGLLCCWCQKTNMQPPPLPQLALNIHHLKTCQTSFEHSSFKHLLNASSPMSSTCFTVAAFCHFSLLLSRPSVL